MNRLADQGSENAVKMERREMDKTRQPFDGECLGQMVLDVVDDAVNAPAVNISRFPSALAMAGSGSPIIC